jgi:hypothetical protein
LGESEEGGCETPAGVERGAEFGLKEIKL